MLYYPDFAITIIFLFTIILVSKILIVLRILIVITIITVCLLIVIIRAVGFRVWGVSLSASLGLSFERLKLYGSGG